MPVVASEECRCELARRSNVRVTVQGVADLVGILFVNTGQRQIGEALGSVGVEGGRGRPRLSSSAHDETQQNYDGFHSQINLNDPAHAGAGWTFRKWNGKLKIADSWALNSAVECHPHTVEVVGSNPTAPTIQPRIRRTFPVMRRRSAWGLRSRLDSYRLLAAICAVLGGAARRDYSLGHS